MFPRRDSSEFPTFSTIGIFFPVATMNTSSSLTPLIKSAARVAPTLYFGLSSFSSFPLRRFNFVLLPCHPGLVH